MVSHKQCLLPVSSSLIVRGEAMALCQTPSSSMLASRPFRSSSSLLSAADKASLLHAKGGLRLGAWRWRPCRHQRAGVSTNHSALKAVAGEQNGSVKTGGFFPSSWDAKDSEGKDYLYRLGRESDNLRITVGAKEGIIDDLFTGSFLGKDADIVFKYRQKVTRSFQHLQGDYYIAPAFFDKMVLFLVKNYIAEQMNSKVPLILGVWGGKGQGKTFQTELVFKALDIEPVIMSAGELESEWAGEPGRLIRDRYRTAASVIKNKGKMSCLVINDLDAGLGRYENTQVTVNNQIVMGTLMNLCDNPTRVSIGQDWREADVINRVPIIITGNDLSTLYAPLIRDGRMEKFYWQPTRDDLIKIVAKMYQKDDLHESDIAVIVDTFPNQALDFYGAMRSRTYDDKIREWIVGIGGEQNMQKKLMNLKKGEEPVIDVPKQTLEGLLAAGHSLALEQKHVSQNRLSEDYMKNIDKESTSGGGIGFSS